MVEAYALLMERFPKLALLLSSFPYVEAEKERFAPPQLSHVKLLYIYGIGQGASYEGLKSWLKEDREREVVFLEDEPGKLVSFLHIPEALEVLSDSQVHLELLSRGRSLEAELTALAEKRPAAQVAIVALPSKRGRRFRALRLSLLRKTALAQALSFDRLYGYQLFENFVQNLSHLPSSFYANGLKNAFAGETAIVCGAGPSLQAAIPLLREMEGRALLIAGGSTLAALSSQGILPHFGMAIDPNFEEYLRLKNSFAFEVPLLYSTRVFPGIFRTCNGPFGYMRTGAGGALELWMEEALGLSEPLIGERLSQEAISVTTLCIAWAEFLGCNPILLSGVDLAYTNRRRYAEGVEEVPSSMEEGIAAADQLIKRRGRNGKQVFTATRWIMEAASIAHFAKKHKKVQFINTTEGGIPLRGIPYQSLSSTIQQLPRAKNLRKTVHEKIITSPMPTCTATEILLQMKKLSESLQRIVEQLEILADKRRGSKALAELELTEEYAYPYLFYDAPNLFRNEKRWERFLAHAQEYSSRCLLMIYRNKLKSWFLPASDSH